MSPPDLGYFHPCSEPMRPTRILKWAGLTVACAMPLIVIVQPHPPRMDLVLAEVLGVAVWVIVMASVDTLLSRGNKEAVRHALVVGVVTWALVQAAAASVPAFRNWWMAFYFPGVIIAELMGRAAPLRVAPRVYHFIVLVLACGAMNLIAALLLGLVYGNARVFLQRRRALDASTS